MEPTEQDIKNQVREALCRLVRDALEFNDTQDPEVREDSENDILDDAELLMQYLKLKDMKR